MIDKITRNVTFLSKVHFYGILVVLKAGVFGRFFGVLVILHKLYIFYLKEGFLAVFAISEQKLRNEGVFEIKRGFLRRGGLYIYSNMSRESRKMAIMC